MAQFNENIFIAAPNPIDFKYLSPRTVNGIQQPYSATTEVLNTLSIPQRHVGLTVLVGSGVGRKEYWFKDDVNTLVEKLGEGVAGRGDSIRKVLEVTDHSFAVGDVIGHSGGTYVKAIADIDFDGEILGIVSEVVNTNEFEIVFSGFIEELSGLNPSTTYFLSTTNTGNLTSTKPNVIGNVIKPMLIAETANTGWVLPYPPYVLTEQSTGVTLNVQNVGTGIGLFSGSSETEYFFRSIVGTGDTSVSLVDDTIVINTEVPDPVVSFTGLTDTPNNYEENAYIKVSGDSLVYVDNVLVDIGAISGATNIGDGEDVFKDVTGNTINLRTIKGGGDTTVTTSGDSIIVHTEVLDVRTDAIRKVITQPGHGFDVQDVVGFSGSTYNKPIANGLYVGEVLGVISRVVDVDQFELTQAGYITGLTGLLQGTTYFLSPTTPGFLTDVEPNQDGQLSKAVLIAETSTTGWVLPYVGYIVGDFITGDTTGGTGGSLTVEDEGVIELTEVTHLNFVGADVKAVNVSSGGVRRVNVYIPPPEYAPNFNTTNVSTTNRYVALPDSEGDPYKIGGWISGGVEAPTIRSGVTTITYTSTQFSIFNDVDTTLEVVVFDADDTTPLATNQITLTGNTSQTNQNITINITDWDNDFDRFKATAQIQIDIATILPEGGRFGVSLTHDNSPDGTHTFSQPNLFRDREEFTPKFNDVTGGVTVLPENPNIKQISGVHFYGHNSEWRVDVTGMDYLNSRSYPALGVNNRQAQIVGTNFIQLSNQLINIHGESSTTFNTGTWDRQHDNTGAAYTRLNWLSNQTNQSNWVHGGCTINPNQATARLYSWNMGTPDDTLNSISYNYLIDTYVDASARNTEMFRREDHPTFPRLRSNLTTPWDRTASLATEDGGTGLQVLANRLVYPQCNFTGFLPATQPNYTALGDNRFYYRRFETSGPTVSNGIIELVTHNITENDLDTDNVIFEISIDDGTSWFRLNDDYPGGTIGDGDGCRINPLTNALNINNRLEFTFGAGKFNNYIHLKITYTTGATSRFITGINLLGANWA